MPRTFVPTSIRLPPKIKAALMEVASSRRWNLSETILVACEELIGRYLFNKKVRKRKPKPQNADQSLRPPDPPLDFSSEN